MKQGFFDDKAAAIAMKLLIMEPTYLFTCSDQKLETILKQITDTRAAFKYHERRPRCPVVSLPPLMGITYKPKFDHLETLINQTLFRRKHGHSTPQKLKLV